MIDDRDPPAEPPVTEDIGLPTPPSPGRLPPPHLPPVPQRADAPPSDGKSPDRSDA